MDKLRAERQGAKDRDAWAAAGEKMADASDKHRFDIRNVLTDEQKKNLDERRGENFGGRGPGMAAQGNMGGRCPYMMGPGQMGGGRCWRR